MSSNTNKANKALRSYAVIWTSERKKNTELNFSVFYKFLSSESVKDILTNSDKRAETKINRSTRFC